MHDGIETSKCDCCGIEENIDLLDAKDDGSGDFTILECIRCYGPGWLPMSHVDLRASVASELAPLYADHLRGREHALEDERRRMRGEISGLTKSLDGAHRRIAELEQSGGAAESDLPAPAP